MEAGEYRLTRGTCFVARRLDVVAVTGLLWTSWCVSDAAGFFRFFFSFFFFSFERTWPAASMRPPCLIYLSTSTGVRTKCQYLISLSVCVSVGVCMCNICRFTGCESCTKPISTNPGSMEAGEHGLTRGTCFVARRLEVVAVAGLLWISCVFSVGQIFSCFFFFDFFFASNANGLLLGMNRLALFTSLLYSTTWVCTSISIIYLHTRYIKSTGIHNMKPTSLVYCTWYVCMYVCMYVCVSHQVQEQDTNSMFLWIFCGLCETAEYHIIIPVLRSFRCFFIWKNTAKR